MTMCPPSYHHNGFMATPEFGHAQDVRCIYIYICIQIGFLLWPYSALHQNGAKLKLKIKD